jgi:signal transduction histidine kinase
MMRFRHSIRARIFLSYAALGAVTGAAFWVLTLLAFEFWERQLMDTFVAGELDYFVEETAASPGNQIKKSSAWTAYKIVDGPLPEELKHFSAMPPGIHEIVIDARNFDLGVARRNGITYYLFYDDTALEYLESTLARLLLMATILAFVLAAAYGYRLSRRVIQPVSALAGAIRGLDEQRPTQLECSGFADDEIGELAEAFNSYLLRLAGFIRREQDFTANISHELRTPLAAIRAIAEGLLARSDLPNDVVYRLGRLEKSAADMAEQFSCLLLLARESGVNGTPCAPVAIAAILDDVARDCRAQLRSSVALTLHCVDEPQVAAPPRVVAMVIGNLLRNACSYTLSGTIDVYLSKHCLRVDDTGTGIVGADLPRVFERGFRGTSADEVGAGLGLSIVQRFCEIYGWRIALDSAPGRGTSVRWHFAGDVIVPT